MYFSATKDSTISLIRKAFKNGNSTIFIRPELIVFEDRSCSSSFCRMTFQGYNLIERRIWRCSYGYLLIFTDCESHSQNWATGPLCIREKSTFRSDERVHNWSPRLINLLLQIHVCVVNDMWHIWEQKHSGYIKKHAFPIRMKLMWFIFPSFTYISQSSFYLATGL